MEEILVSQAVLEKLRCSVCKGYLSCSPIRVTSNGGSICGRCMSSCDAPPTYRNLILEEMISKLSFPCRFREYGCEECLPFGKTNQHEEKCIYRALLCPLVTCIWTGLTLDLPDHFIKNHADFIKEAPKFKIERNQDKHGIFMTTIDEIPFFIKYSYNFFEDEVHFGEFIVSYFSKKVEDAPYDMRWSEDTGFDDTWTEHGTCVPYDVNFSEPPDFAVFELGDTSCIEVTLVLHIKKRKEIVN